QFSKTIIGEENDDNNGGENDESNSAVTFEGSGSLLQSLLDRVHNIEQYCRQLVQMQTQQAQHIITLEAAIQSTASIRTLSPRPEAVSTAESESGAISAAEAAAASTAFATTGAYPLTTYHTHQIHQTHAASRSATDSAAISPRGRSRSPVVSSAAVISSSLSSAIPMHEASSSAFGTCQGVHHTQYPQLASAGPSIQQQNQRQAHETGGTLSEASIQQQQAHSHYRRGSFGLFQLPSAGYQSATPSSSSPNRRFNPYHHTGGASPYSARTSPTGHAQKQQHPAAPGVVDANLGSVGSRAGNTLFSASSDPPSMPGQRRPEPSGPSFTETTRSTFQVSRVRSRRGSSSAHHGQHRSRHHISPSSSSVWMTPQQQQQHQHQHQTHGIMYPYAVVDEGRHAVAPYAVSQTQPHDVSAFGYMVPSASASAAAHASATGSSSRPGGGEQYSISQQLFAAGPASTRAKRPRVAEMGGASLYSSLPSSSSSSNEAALQMPPFHGHAGHNVLPPIRSSTGVRGSASGAGIDPSPVPPPPPPLPLPPPQVATASALGHGRRAEERGDSLPLTRPDLAIPQHSIHAAKDRKGKILAVDIAGISGSSGSAGTRTGSSSRGTTKRAPNPEAQPTPTWLATQRRYKVGLLHLLTLESFYPSDVAMLNMFRAQGDFSNEQIETHGATLLSWARSWLRYNRNAVLRSTLENKAKVPLPQLAEALQHDLHAETDFTEVPNLRRCALLRLIYFQWQAINKLGTKSQSLYRDYEIRLREIEALPTVHEQEADWGAILDEEQSRRLALIRESRGSGGSAILPRPEQNLQQRHQPMQSVVMARQGTPSASRMQQRGSAPEPLRHSISDWPAHSATEAGVTSEHYYPQHYAVASMGSPVGIQQQQQHREAMEVEGSAWDDQGRRGGIQAVGKDDDSEMSVNLSPEPHH
ncbi:hypothetical protein EV179_004862, partial [Coemansia sp. RSA 487]